MNKYKSLWALIFVLIFLPSLVLAATTATIAPDPAFRSLDSNGDPRAGAKLYTYITGTLTPKTTWTDSTKGTPNTNPVILDSNGEASVWIDSSDGAYRFTLDDADDVNVWGPLDGILGMRDLTGGFEIGHTAAGLHKGYRLLSEFSDNFATAVAAVGATPTTLLVAAAPDALTGHIAVPSTLDIVWLQGYPVTMGAYNFVINGDPPDAGRYQIFDESGAGEVSLSGDVVPEWWGPNTTPGTTNMSDEFNSMTTALDNAGGGDIYYTGETYIVGDIVTYGNINHHGAYGKTILKKPSGATYVMSVNPVAGGTTDPDDNEMNILIEYMTFDGSSETLGFSQFKHTLNLNAVSDLIVKYSKFIHPQGDSIYLGSSNSSVERHNERIKFLYNDFDGWDGSANAGRNAISVIDVVDLEIIGGSIKRTATAGMPGGIDIEPNSWAYARIQDITIKGVSFEDNNRAAIQIVLNKADTYTLPPRGFKILKNYFGSTNSFPSTLIRVRLFNSDTPYLVTATDASHGVLISGNYANDSGGAVLISGTKGTIFTKNTLYKSSALVLGNYESTTGENNFDLLVEGNTFDRSGNSSGQIIVGVIDGLKIVNDLFRDPNDSGANQRAIAFLGSGVTTTSRNVTISGDTFEGTMIDAVHVLSHTLDPETNRWFGNTIKAGVGREFGFDYENLTATSEVVVASVLIKTTHITTNGDGDEDIVSLPNGQPGQIKIFTSSVEGAGGDSWKLVPYAANFGTKISFDGDVGDGVMLEWDENGWNIIANNGGVIS